MSHLLLFLAVAVLTVAAVWTLTFFYDLGTCGSAPVCGPLQESVVYA